MKSLFSSHMAITEKVLDMQLKRQNVVMSNLANLKTPGYKERTLEFEEDLQKALNLDAQGKMTRTAGSHMPAVFNPDNFGPEWDKVFKPRVVHGEDQVDIDKEMAKMAKNNMRYNALATILKGNFEGLNKIITEGQK
ncbi:flagellar basal body rod protein FlgB [Desulfovibrio subterraneus]|jgi:flagellar basal-body rod protein FlgB|uniref:Flagellar basal body rod protein FlgB n=1 Tax=Desulfovibrio subterraneus TaxID=2718620 RepID=A0A7J0BP49_9BACT|nr:flagellar basal body rod protein FlgB [Desulfovibrio subterraneus]WBF66320.1 flagellar basal body rod protein FlgB [Desulfovibrio subterraneus]GFM34834.1 flagellar basal body rod protein FlgB [Desulfovibrio subterraneus]